MLNISVPKKKKSIFACTWKRQGKGEKNKDGEKEWTMVCIDRLSCGKFI